MIGEGEIVPFEASALPVEKGPWLVFAPHPDDESFGMGGSLLKAAGAGIETELVIMTDGALGGSHPDLVSIRRGEAEAAAAFLGIKKVIHLEQKDRGLAYSEALAARLADIIRREAPAAVFFPGVYEFHPDHRMTAKLVWEALRQCRMPEISPVSYEISVQSPVNRLVDISGQADKKRALLEIYKSQLEENNYIEVVMALNKLRTLTLPAEVQYAEGFHIFGKIDRNLHNKTLEEIALTDCQKLF